MKSRSVALLATIVAVALACGADDSPEPAATEVAPLPGSPPVASAATSAPPAEAPATEAAPPADESKPGAV